MGQHIWLGKVKIISRNLLDVALGMHKIKSHELDSPMNYIGRTVTIFL